MIAAIALLVGLAVLFGVLGILDFDRAPRIPDLPSVEEDYTAVLSSLRIWRRDPE
jgi:hypothetical protein